MNWLLHIGSLLIYSTDVGVLGVGSYVESINLESAVFLAPGCRWGFGGVSVTPIQIPFDTEGVT